MMKTGENEDQHCIFPFQTSDRFSEVQAGRGGSVQPLRHRQAGRRESHRAEYLPWLHSLPGDIYTVLEHVAQQSVEPGRQQEHHRRFLCWNRIDFSPSLKYLRTKLFVKSSNTR